MRETPHPLAQLLQEDRRYRYEAYAFVFEALNFAHKKLGMGHPVEAEPSEDDSEDVEKATQRERHVTGPELCEAIRLLALEQFGYMAKCVFESWGVRSTGDFGEIVFNLIRIGQMRKTDSDKRSDFEDVFDFEIGLTQSFKITMPE